MGCVGHHLNSLFFKICSYFCSCKFHISVWHVGCDDHHLNSLSFIFHSLLKLPLQDIRFRFIENVILLLLWFKPSVHLDGCLQTFRDGMHLQLLAQVKRESSILKEEEGGFGGERDEELERTWNRREMDCKWDNKPLRGWFLKTILRRLIFRKDLLLSLFVYT